MLLRLRLMALTQLLHRDTPGIALMVPTQRWTRLRSEGSAARGLACVEHGG